MQTVEISGKVTTTPEFSKKLSMYTFMFEYQPDRIFQALAQARPPIPTIIHFEVVVPEKLMHKGTRLKSGDTCVLVYPRNPDIDTPLYPVDILIKSSELSPTP